MVNKYKKKPVVIEAILWDTKNFSEIKKFCGGCAQLDDSGYLWISTLEGIHSATAGDYIIKGINGEFYPCKPDIFKKTYDLVED